MAYIGFTLPITWSAVDFVDPDGVPLADGIKVELSRNGGSSWETLVASTPNTGSYSWTVDGATSDNCVVRVSDAADLAITDTSGVFAIADAPTSSGASDSGIIVGGGVSVCI